MGLFAGLFTFFVLSTRRMERLRKPFFIGLFVLVVVTLTSNILFFGYRSFMVWVSEWATGYYSPSATRVGTTPFPLPIIIPAILLGKAQFIIKDSVWQTEFPTSLALFFLFMVPYAITLLVFERAFCGWICPFGGLPEAMMAIKQGKWQLSFLKKKPSTPGGFSFTGLTGLKGWVEWVRYGILLTVILLAFLVPFAIVNIITPALWLKSIPVFWTGAGIIVVFAIVLPLLTNRRWWCYTVCPVGTTLALLHKISLFRIKIDRKKCNECMDCVQECRYFAMTPQGVERGGPMSGNCIRCGRCIEVCPEEAIDIAWLGKYKNVRAPFITLVLGTVFAWYLWFIVLIVSYSAKIGQFQGL